jgi:hypothetical protein
MSSSEEAKMDLHNSAKGSKCYHSLLTLLPLRWRQQIPPKPWCLSPGQDNANHTSINGRENLSLTRETGCFEKSSTMVFQMLLCYLVTFNACKR